MATAPEARAEAPTTASRFEVRVEVPIQDPYRLTAMISLPDLGHDKPSIGDLVEMAKQFNREAGTGFLARLNLYLSLVQGSSETNKVIEVQEKLTREVLLPSRLQEIVKAFTNRNLYEKWILLHKAQLLVGIKLIALYGREEGGNCLQSDEDRAKIGELALAINSCYGPGLGEPNWPLEDVIVELAASAELSSSETLVSGLVRTRILLGPIFRDYLAGLKAENWPPPFERVFTLLNGLNFREFLDVMLYLYIEHRGMLTEILEAGAMAYADVTKPNRYVSGRSMKAWAELMSVGHDNLKALVQGSERDPAFFFGFCAGIWRNAHSRPLSER